MDGSKLCRCCLSNNANKDMNVKYNYKEINEIYSDMLQECFNILVCILKFILF